MAGVAQRAGVAADEGGERHEDKRHEDGGGLQGKKLLTVKERQSLRELISRQRLPLRWALYLLCLFAVLIFGIYGPGYDSAQFIYMNF